MALPSVIGKAQPRTELRPGRQRRLTQEPLHPGKPRRKTLYRIHEINL